MTPFVHFCSSQNGILLLHINVLTSIDMALCSEV